MTLLERRLATLERTSPPGVEKITMIRRVVLAPDADGQWQPVRTIERVIVTDARS
ncbi:hypothetical protein [Acidiphilium sp.]|uniref:hypothetical protein n=1 Tax=Acidiphilium sp. TaxID=527 RepID=UPI003D0890C9